MSNFPQEPKDGNFIKYIEEINKKSFHDLKQNIINENIGKDSLQNQIKETNQYKSANKASLQKQLDKNNQFQSVDTAALQKQLDESNQCENVTTSSVQKQRNNSKKVDNTSLQKQRSKSNKFKNTKSNQDRDFITINISNKKYREKVRQSKLANSANKSTSEQNIKAVHKSSKLDIVFTIILLLSILLAYMTEESFFIALIFITALIITLRNKR